jgi:lysophospholipase L1-like esterase
MQPAGIQQSMQPTGSQKSMHSAGLRQPNRQFTVAQAERYKCERSELRPKLLFLGDSNTEEAMMIPSSGGGGEAYSQDDDADDEFGWVARVKAKVGTRRADLVQRGYDGFNTRKALVMLPAILKDFKEPFLFATVAFGSNDMADAVDPDVHVPVEEYEQNMRKIIQGIKNGPGVEHVVVWSPPPVDNTRWPTRRNESVLLYTSAAQRAAEAEGATFVNSYEIFKDVWGTSTRDGLHLNQGGGKILAQAILKALPEDILCENKGLPMDFPLFRDVSNSDVASSLTADALAKLSYPVKPQKYD